MTYRLEDVAQKHREHPNGFCMPREAVRHALQVGEIVSIGLIPENQENAEWMWVRIEVKRDGGRYIGVLLDKPKTVPQLDTGYRVDFSADNIFELYIEEGDERWFDHSLLAMVSGHVADGSSWPGRLMRIPPPAPQYSGWLIYSGNESREYISDFSNFASQPLSELIELYPNLESVLASPIGAEWRWDADAAEYRN